MCVPLSASARVGLPADVPITQSAGRERVICAIDRSRPADVPAKQAAKEDLITDVDPLTTAIIIHTWKVGSHLISVIFAHELVKRN